MYGKLSARFPHVYYFTYPNSKFQEQNKRRKTKKAWERVAIVVVLKIWIKRDLFKYSFQKNVSSQGWRQPKSGIDKDT